MNYPVLLVDDNRVLADALSECLECEGFKVSTAYTFNTAIELLNSGQYYINILDMKLPDGSGVELASYIEEKFPFSKTILITAYHEEILDNKTKELGRIFDYLPKPFNLSHAVKRVRNALELYLLETEQSESIMREKQEVDKIIGISGVMNDVKQIIHQSSGVNSSVLITGETGTGKELVARAIHFSNPKPKGKFIPVNCSAIPETLFESEFFGYEKGAFTGAEKRRRGLFELADKGTLFLDEIGEMPVEFQSKLLRVLETGEFRKLGSESITKVNVRVVAATNKILENEIKSGRSFREDLYYRLSVIRITLPPLRERRDDIIPIARYLWKNISLNLKKQIPYPDDGFFEALKDRYWSGNVRELANHLERIIILSGTKVREPNTLNDEICSENICTLDEITKNHILKVYKLMGSNKARTAKKLDISLSTLKRKLRDYAQL